MSTVALGDGLTSEAPAATPYRPSVSTPAALSAPGWLEVESGVLRVGPSGGDRRESLPYTLKLALSADWGLRLGGEAVVRRVDALGVRESGFGDSSLVLKRRFAVNDHSAFGLELGGNFATARAGLGSGSGGTDVSLNSIYSADIGALHTDLNLLVTRMAHVASNESQVLGLYAVALSGSLTPRWAVVGELSGTGQRGVSSTAQWLGAVSFSPTRRVTLDGGIAKGFLAGASSWSMFLGGTVLVTRVF